MAARESRRVLVGFVLLVGAALVVATIAALVWKTHRARDLAAFETSCGQIEREVREGRAMPPFSARARSLLVAETEERLADIGPLAARLDDPDRRLADRVRRLSEQWRELELLWKKCDRDELALSKAEFDGNGISGP